MAKKPLTSGRRKKSQPASKKPGSKPEAKKPVEKVSPQSMTVVAADAAALTGAKPSVIRSGAKQPSPAQIRRLALRDAEFGENAASRVWHKKEVAFCTIPRALSLLCTLIRNLRRGADAERVYLDLWTRQHEDGFVEVYDEDEFAMSCDYADGSGTRYWRVGMNELERLGFIEVKKMNKRKHGYVLLVHPEDVVRKIYADPKTTAPAWWLPMFEQLLRRQGAKKRVAPKSAEPAKPAAS